MVANHYPVVEILLSVIAGTEDLDNPLLKPRKLVNYS